MKRAMRDKPDTQVNIYFGEFHPLEFILKADFDTKVLQTKI